MEPAFTLFLTVFILMYILWDSHFESIQIQRCEQYKIKHAFYCMDCKHLYSGASEIENCPYCGKKNQYLHF